MKIIWVSVLLLNATRQWRGEASGTTSQSRYRSPPQNTLTKLQARKESHLPKWMKLHFKEYVCKRKHFMQEYLNDQIKQIFVSCLLLKDKGCDSVLGERNVKQSAWHLSVELCDQFVYLLRVGTYTFLYSLLRKSLANIPC